jgi:hypothetical protein
MHPMMHLSLLFTSMILIALDQSGFYANAGSVPKDTPAYKFMTEGKTETMFIIMSAHLICSVLHFLGSYWR